MLQPFHFRFGLVLTVCRHNARFIFTPILKISTKLATLVFFLLSSTLWSLGCCIVVVQSRLIFNIIGCSLAWLFFFKKNCADFFGWYCRWFLKKTFSIYLAPYRYFFKANRGESSLYYWGRVTPIIWTKLVKNYCSSQLNNDANPAV